MRKPSTLRATAAHSEAEEARVITTIGLLRTSFARMVAR
jgi:hypothetical protein